MENVRVILCLPGTQYQDAVRLDAPDTAVELLLPIGTRSRDTVVTLTITDDIMKRIAQHVAGMPLLHGQITTALSSVLAERLSQQKLWGEEHDDAHEIGDWIIMISDYLGRASREVVAEAPNAGRDYRKRLVQVSAVALAAVEAFDRSGE